MMLSMTPVNLSINNYVSLIHISLNCWMTLSMTPVNLPINNCVSIIHISLNLTCFHLSERPLYPSVSTNQIQSTRNPTCVDQSERPLPGRMAAITSHQSYPVSIWYSSIPTRNSGATCVTGSRLFATRIT